MNSSAQNAGLIYEFFDFHKECSKMRYDRLSILVNRMAKYDFGYFAVDTNSSSKQRTIIKRQDGVFRTNCMVIQALLLCATILVQKVNFHLFSSSLPCFDK